MESIETPKHKLELWKQHIAKYIDDKGTKEKPIVAEILQEHDIDVLLQGSTLGRRRQAQTGRSASNPTDGIDSDSISSDDSDDEDEDPDFTIDGEIDSDYLSSDWSDSDMEEELQLLDDDDSFEVYENTFLEDVLENLRKIPNKHNWKNKTTSDLVQFYLTDTTKATNLYHEELDVFNGMILTYTGVQIFQKSTSKFEKVTRLIRNLGQHCAPVKNSIPVTHQPKSLLLLAKKGLLDKMYPKIMLCIVVAKCKIKSEMQHWERRSTIPTILQIENENEEVYFEHKIYSYPNYSAIRNQVEHRCTDPGHTLANIRSQISRHGYDYVSTDAFAQISTSNHEVLPRSIVLDQLDKQSIPIAKRFFSTEVESVLSSNDNIEEANFVKLVRNWFESCDERGITTFERLYNLQRMYNFLDAKLDYTDFPPPTQYIEGMPVQTYECIMQGISTRMALYASSDLPINQRSISTLAVESFFSQLTQMEFTGLGCPKSVDIPRLITHVTELNNVRHDANR